MAVLVLLFNLTESLAITLCDPQLILLEVKEYGILKLYFRKIRICEKPNDAKRFTDFWR